MLQARSGFAAAVLVRLSFGRRLVRVDLHRQAKSVHAGFAQDKSYSRGIIRVDGQPKLAAPITPDSGDTLSPFVTLDIRSVSPPGPSGARCPADVRGRASVGGGSSKKFDSAYTSKGRIAAAVLENRSPKGRLPALVAPAADACSQQPRAEQEHRAGFWDCC
jgi:hypothetical protein